MPFPFGSHDWPNVRKLVEFFVLNGCVLQEVPANLEGPAVRYLHSYETDDFVTLSGLDDDDLVPPSTVEQWERRLGFALPRDNPH